MAVNAYAGERNGRALLGVREVRLIRKAARLRKRLTNKALAARFGVSPHTVGEIVQGTRWQSVE